MRNSATADPFDTASIRARVLDAWRASPHRLREDANSEEDYALGGYRDRVVVELAQNAADAARQAGVDCRILVRLTDDALSFANTGAGLDVDGVRSLASLRASAKRDEPAATGRFGVGFAAVLGVTDEPIVASGHGAVRFSAAMTREIVSAEPALTDELQHRSGHVPVLRLPFATELDIPTGYDTVVMLPLRDQVAHETAVALVAAIDDALFLALPDITEVVVELGNASTRTLHAERSAGAVVVFDGEESTRWRVSSTSGQLDPDLLVDRPTEERRRGQWSATWAIPVDAEGVPVPLPLRIPSVLHAPTPSAEPVGLDALLVATFPLDPSRQHVPSGPLTDYLVDSCAKAYVELATAVIAERGPTALSLVPPPRIVGHLDAALRESIRAELRNRPLLRAAHGNTLLARDQAVVVDGGDEVIGVLGDVIDGLVSPAWAQSATVLNLLEPETRSLADVLDAIADVRRPPSWWYSLYTSLEGVDSSQLEGLPVPLVDGRLARDVRGCVLPTTDAELLAALGLRVIHPEAAHPLLERLGARSGEARAVLADPRLHEQLSAESWGTERSQLSRSVLALVEQADLRAGDEPALGEVPVMLTDGSWAPARGTVLPSSPLQAVAVDEVEVVDVGFVAEVGAAALSAVGVLSGLGVVRHHDVLLDPDQVDQLVPDGGAWVDHLATITGTDHVGSALCDELTLVVGLDVVADDAWGRALSLLVEPAVRQAILEPARIVLGDGRHVQAPSFAAWWLSEAPLFDGYASTRSCLPGDERLVGLYHPVPAAALALGIDVLSAIGVRASVEELLVQPHGADDLLERLTDDGVDVTPRALSALYRALSATVVEHWPTPPDQLRIARGDRTLVVPSSDVMIVVAPHHWPLAGDSAIVGSDQLAEILDVATTAEATASVEFVEGAERPMPSVVRELFPNVPPSYVEHDDIVCNGSSVQWWIGDDRVIHAATVDGLARAVAWHTKSWPRRWELSAVLAEPDRFSEAQVERAFDEP